uniref:Ig-like domain-containing protein n=1 Tax=Amphilophus citrinellus TaxID=61819 RepID=A0A3Q0S8T6_AMPCI
MNTFASHCNASVPGVICSACKVNSQEPHMCAVKGSSIVILCSFSCPDKENVQRVMWSHEENIFDGPFIYASDSNNSASRFRYIGNKQDNCSLQMHHVERSDKGKYSCESPLVFISQRQSVQEGDSVNLTCTNSCDRRNLSFVFTWFKNGGRLHERQMLHLRNVSFTDSGNYSCSLKADTEATSEVLHVDVECEYCTEILSLLTLAFFFENRSCFMLSDCEEEVTYATINFHTKRKADM